MEKAVQVERAQEDDVLSIEQLKDAWRRAESVELGDPVLANVRLQYNRTFSPLGFPVCVETNSEAVLDAAQESWGRFGHQFDTEPVRLQVTVTEGETRVCPPTPLCRMRSHILSNVADSENYVVTDLAKLHSTVWVTQAAVAHGDYFRYFFLESAALACINAVHTTAIHAGCIALDGQAVLLCGDSGAGKTTLSYACALAGWTYITDDGSYLVHSVDERMVVGNCNQVRFRPSAQALFPHLSGREVMQRAGVGKPSIELPIQSGESIRTATSAQVQYMVFLQRQAEREELVPFPSAIAKMYLWQRVHCMPYQASRHLQALEGLLKVEAFELRYQSLEWAIDRLTQLVREGR